LDNCVCFTGFIIITRTTIKIKLLKNTLLGMGWEIGWVNLHLLLYLTRMKQGWVFTRLWPWSNLEKIWFNWVECFSIFNYLAGWFTTLLVLLLCDDLISSTCLQTNTSAASSLGTYFLSQISLIFLDMLNVYRCAFHCYSLMIF